MRFITQEGEAIISYAVQVLYFYISQMPLHSKFMTMMHAAEDLHKEIIFMAIDISQFNNQCKRFSVDSVPTVILLKDGKEIGRISNTFSTDTFKSILSDICVV